MKRTTIAAVAAAVATIAAAVAAIASGDTSGDTVHLLTPVNTPTARPAPAAPAAPQGTLGVPLNVAGKFTITITTPADTGGKWACNPVGVDGHCQLHSELTATVTAIETVALDQLELKALDDNHDKLWLGELGPSVPLPTGRTHTKRGIAVDYSGDAKTRALPLIWLHLTGDETHLAEWTYQG